MRKKSLPDDLSLALNSDEDPIERASAITRLGADGQQASAQIVGLLSDQEPPVVSGAYTVLLVYWGRLEYLGSAIDRFPRRAYTSDLEYARFAWLREDLARLLGGIGRSTPTHAAEVLTVLLNQLASGDNPSVLHACYVGVLETVEGRYPRERPPIPFRVERDVDFERIASGIESSEVMSVLDSLKRRILLLSN